VKIEDVQPCGTRAAAQRHRRADEDPCEPCRKAEREHNRRQRLQKLIDQAKVA
jgi:hypothetical protein